jgi:hypothetical protein
MLTATLTKEINIETPNTVGIAAKLTQIVAKQTNANIRAAWASGFNGQGHFSLITDNNLKAIEALKTEFPKIKEREVLVVNAKNTVGEIADVTNKISQANLSIDFLFTTYFGDKPAIVISTDNNKKALELFNNN